MGNRSMDAKRIKYIRQSKARPRYLRPDYGKINGKKPINNAYRVPKELEALFAYNDRAKSSSLEEYFNIKFPSHNQISDDRDAALRDSRKEAKERILQVEVVSGRLRKVTLFHNTTDTCFYFVEYLTTLQLWRQSITYATRDRALAVFTASALKWKEVIQLGVETIST